MPENLHFATLDDLDSAEEAVGFAPLARRIRSHPTGIRAHVRDQRMGEVEPTLEVASAGGRRRVTKEGRSPSPKTPIRVFRQ